MTGLVKQATVALGQFSGALFFKAATFALASLVLGLSPPAGAISPNIVISQIQGGGGNSGAAYKNDYIELFNRGATSVSIAGWSVQYASATGTSWTVTALSGSIPAGGYYLVQEAAGAGAQPALPTPNATGTIAMSATAGKVALVNSTVALTGSGCPFGATVVDFVGYGATANCSETANTPAPSNALAVLRAAAGCTDTDSNSADFATGAAAPRNSATAANSCSSLPNISIDDVTVAEGNAGNTAFSFTVSLSAPAPAGGVTFNIVTADGTALAGSDYIAQSLMNQTIPAGNSTYTFTVQVNGDTLPEANESFVVNLDTVVNANVADGQGLGTITNDDAAPNLTINDVTQSEGDAGTSNFTFTVSLSAPAPAGGVTFNIATTDGTALAGSDYVAKSLMNQTIPAGNTTYTFDVVVNGDTAGEQTETFLVNLTSVVNAIPLDSQGVGTIPNDDAQRIHAVQGSGNTSPFAGQTVIIEGIVTAVFQTANSLGGFYVQQTDATADADPLTSEGVFVYTNLAPAAVAVGQLVRVTGTVTEFGTAPNTLTEIVTPTVVVLSSGNPLPAYATVNLPVAALGDLERFEGMRVQFAQALTVSDHANLARFGELSLSANGRIMQPTNVVDPNDNPASGNTTAGSGNVAAVTALVNLNSRSSIILDDASTLSNPPVIPFLDPTTSTIRLGTTVTGLTGILSQSFGSHRIFADTPPPFSYAARPATPPAVGGNVKVASMNVLNYFNGNGAGGGFPTSRGADSLLEFNRQRDKVIATVAGIGADVIGLMEIENDGNAATSSIQDLIDGVNALAGAGAWAFVADPAFIGTDQIRSAIIYRTAAVAPVGTALSSTDPVFNRPPVAQTFRLLANNELFTLVVNHFKSKGGSGSGLDNDQGDGQAEFNNTRRLQAVALLSYMATLTATPRIITMGDFNAYEQEDPIDTMRAGGLATIINNSYSYHFAGQSGSLDHALGTAALMTTVVGADKWHINADEPAILDYNVEGKNTTGCTSSCVSPDHYSTSPFRASDHDPVMVGLQLSAAQTISFGTQGVQTYSTGGTFAVNPLATATSGLSVTYSTLTPAVCFVIGTTVTMQSAGTCTLAADQAGDANFNGTPQVTQNVTINQASQSITFGAQPAQNFSAGGGFMLNPAASASSGLAIVYSSTTASVCTVAGTTVTMVSTGTCTIAADQPGDASFSAALQVTQTVAINKANQTITFTAQAAQTFAAGGSFALNPVASASSGLTVSYSSASPAVCSIIGTTVSVLAAGACTIAADQAGDANFNAAPQVAQGIVINKAAQAINFATVPPQTYSTMGTFMLSATGGASGSAVTFASTTAAVCTVAGNTVTIVAAGACTVTANQAGDANYNAAPQASQSIAINLANQAISFQTVGAQTFSVGGTFSVAATANSGLTVTFSSTTAAFCTVSGTIVTMAGAGTCTIAADQAGNGNYSAAPQVTQNISIAQAAQTITFAPAMPGASAVSWTVAATATSGLAVTFSSTTPAICSVSGSTVTILTIGTCVVAANQMGNANYSAAPQATQNIVHAGAQAIAFAPLPGVNLGTPPFTLAATASSGLAVNFASQTAGVCTTTGINGSTLTILAVGNCTVRATQAGSALYVAATPVNQSFSVRQATTALTLTSSANPAAYGAPVTLTATVTGTNPTGRVTFTVNTASGVTTLCSAVPLAAGSATCAVAGRYQKTNPVYFSASYTGDASNVPAVAVLALQVATKRATLSVSVSPVKPFAGRPMKLTALVRAATFSSKVTFRENGVALTGCADMTVAPLPGASDVGVAICTIASAVAGHHDFVVTYPHTDDAGFEQVIASVDVRSHPVHDYTDMWWAGLAENGWGVSITQHGDIQFIVLYVYDAAGKPTWYVLPSGSWNAAQTAYTGALYRPSGSLFSAYNSQVFKANMPVGTATVTYTGTATATLTYTIDGISGTKSIQRQMFAADDGLPRLTVNDLWWGGDEQNGWGFNIAQQGRVLFPVWYTYDASGNTTWYAMPGGTWDGSTYTGDLYATLSSPWLGATYNAGAFAPTKIGNVVLTFIDQDNATLTYTVGNVTQTKNIVRQPY